MACHFNENVYTTVFTPREYQVELLDTSKESNTIVCLGNNNAKIFVAVKLLQELASEVRKLCGKHSVFLLDVQNVRIMCTHVRNLTDLTVGQYDNLEDVSQYTKEKWKSEMQENQVLVMTSEICHLCIQNGYLILDNINLLIIDDCRLALKQNSLRQLLQDYASLPTHRRPRILGLTTTVLSKSFDPARLEAEFEFMENILNCTVDTSSDVVTVLRYCSKPSEKLMVCANAVPCTLTETLAMYIKDVKHFLDDHRYDPFEIYADDFQDELQDVPDPKVEPLAIFDEFLDILFTMGPWCADRAAFALLIKIENLKVKTPYERHYLLLCMVSTVMVKIRGICDEEFEKCAEGECIYAYSTPRVLRLLEVLKKFKPDTPKKLTITPLLEPAEPSDVTAETSTADVISADCDNSENSQINTQINSIEPSTNVTNIPNGNDVVLGEIIQIVAELTSNIVDLSKNEFEISANAAIASNHNDATTNGNDSAESDSNEIAEPSNKVTGSSSNDSPELSSKSSKTCNSVAKQSNNVIELSNNFSEPNKKIETRNNVSELSKNDNQTNNKIVKQCNKIETCSNIAESHNNVTESSNNVIGEPNSYVVPNNCVTNIESNCNTGFKPNHNIVSKPDINTVIGSTITESSSNIVAETSKNMYSDIQIIISDYDNNDANTSNAIAKDCSNNEIINNVGIQIIITAPDEPDVHTDVAEPNSNIINESSSNIKKLNDNNLPESCENTASSYYVEIIGNSFESYNHVDSISNDELCNNIVESNNSVIQPCDNVISKNHVQSTSNVIESSNISEPSSNIVELSDKVVKSNDDSNSKIFEITNNVNAVTESGSNVVPDVNSNSKVLESSSSLSEPDNDTIVDEDGDELSSNIVPEPSIKDVESESTVSALPNARSWKGRLMRGHRKGPNVRRSNHSSDPDALCGIVFVKKRFTAKILYYLINELCHSNEDFSFLSVQYTVEKIADPITDSREAENEHRKQEEVLKKFRMHECNLLIATSVLEEGIDIPKCNLVIRYDQPKTYNSYVQCKGRAKMPEAHYVLMSDADQLNGMIKQLAQYIEIEKMLLKKCKNREPTEIEQREADLYNSHIKPYSPSNNESGTFVSVATAVALVNKYCAKLPSDTFTRLTPLWWMQNTIVENTVMHLCSIRLPINSPLKQTITGVPMPNRVLARRVTALQVCRLLHQIGELDDNLLPVGKESFKAFEEDWNNFPLEESDEVLTKTNLEPRPGTTKRRQYYYKRVADALTDCRPMSGIPTYLYLITMTLTCPLPEEQNTRGRKIYPPEDSAQGFGILTLKQIPKICPFPIFTRSGEVRVGLELASTRIIMTNDQLEKIMEFLNYIFTNVLRLQKYLMLFDPNASENSYFIVPTQTSESGITDVDWNFLNEIYENRNLTPHIVPQMERTDFQFKAEIYQDAVVMPWYRNQDQPQYFYVAEICSHLNPKSSFPGTDYSTFEEYYLKKYGIQIQNLKQPLLDVDHTSARLNFLTPRYVNRKGVALPTSSEETKRAKRENLEQKQILVPELCTVHPFPASLWRKAVCLPCILYRINALLLADQIRKQVAEELALGLVELNSDFEWTPLNFGWSLSDVLKKSKETRQEKPVEKSPEHTSKEENSVTLVDDKLKIVEITDKEIGEGDDTSDADDEEKDEKDTLEIGIWSNEMASSSGTPTGLKALAEELPNNVTMCSTWENDKLGLVRYGSPTSWMQSPCFDDYDSDYSCDSYSSDPESSDTSNKSGGLRIEFKSDNVAEAIENESNCMKRQLMLMPPEHCEFDECMDEEMEEIVNAHKLRFADAVEKNEKHIMSCGVILPAGSEFRIDKKPEESKPTDEQYETLIKSSLKLPDVNIYSTALNNIEDETSEQVTVVSNGELDPDFEKFNFKFSFDFQPDLSNHPGPSPSVILQALTMSNANDGINLERLETIGDSFLKYAITNYLYSTYDNIHEGKLSHLRSKQVSNLNLYRLGRLKVLGESMIATKFDPHDNWLPPCYYVPKELEQALIDARVPASHWNQADMQTVKDMSKEEICEMVREKGERLGVLGSKSEIGELECTTSSELLNFDTLPCFIPYNLITQHSIPDKSVADCVEALIGAYLIECGPRGALLFMAWLGIRVLPKTEITLPTQTRPTGSLPAIRTENGYKQILYGELTCPRSPLLHHCADPVFELEKLLNGYSEFERNIQYYFCDRSYLLQALTHASYSPNTVTDCYQRLEFLGDAVLDYLITRHLYEDTRLHSPGALTDLRSALVNNTIFASLAVRHGFHKYFRHLSPGLHEVVNRFVQIQEENGHSISEEYYLIAEDESEEIEDVEVPKALGDVFESVAGAIFLDSGMSLDAVWRVYYRMMRNEIEQFSTSVPKSPIRELLELEPETAKFGKPEKLADGRRVRVTVEVFGKGIFKGIGRNYRIAKCTAAKCALKQLKKRGLLVRKN